MGCGEGGPGLGGRDQAGGHAQGDEVVGPQAGKAQLLPTLSRRGSLRFCGDVGSGHLVHLGPVDQQGLHLATCLQPGWIVSAQWVRERSPPSSSWCGNTLGPREARSLEKRDWNQVLLVGKPFIYEARESRLQQAFVCLCIPRWLDLLLDGSKGDQKVSYYSLTQGHQHLVRTLVSAR